MTTRSKELDVRAFDRPDDVLNSEKAHAERVDVGGVAVWRAVFEPGWRLTEDTDGELCPAPHAAYIVSGRLRAKMEDGTEAEAGPGEVMVMQPGHDAWTVGREACVFIDFGQSMTFEAAHR
jgi:uncharacterized cupin superfamily protein